MCRNELGEFYRWWIFVGVRPLLRVPAPAALVLPAHRKLTPTYRAVMLVANAFAHLVKQARTAGLGSNVRHVSIY